MAVPTIAGAVFALFAVAASAQTAGAALDLLPAPGSAPIRLHISQTNAGPSGPQTTTMDVVLRRTGPTTAALERNTDIVPLLVDGDGSLRPPQASVATNDRGLGDLLAALNMAHGVTGVAGAGNRAGWTAEIPIPARLPPPAGPSPSPSPAAPLMLQVRASAIGSNGDLDIDGSAQTSLVAPEASEAPQRQHFRGGGGGGFGGHGGFGGPRGGGDSDADYGPPRGPASTPIALDVHVSAHIARDALTRMTIVQTRRVEMEGLTYSNVGSCTIDVMH